MQYKYLTLLRSFSGEKGLCTLKHRSFCVYPLPPMQSGGKEYFMKIRVMYEENIINGYKIYTTIEIPDGDYSLMLDSDYEMRIAEAKPEKKAEVKRCETVQEMYNLMSNKEFNNWRRFHRNLGKPKTPYRKDDERVDKTDHMDYIPDNSDEEIWEKQTEYENVCAIIRETLKAKQAELIIAIYLDGVSVTEYAEREGVSVSAISHRLDTAKKSFKKVFPKSSTFPSCHG